MTASAEGTPPRAVVPLRRARPWYRNAFALCVAGALAPPVAFAMILPARTGPEGEGIGVAAIVLSAQGHPADALALVASVLFTVGLPVAALLMLPGALARTGAVAAPDGLEITERGLLWREERTGFVRWESVALIVHREAEFDLGHRRVRRGVLDLFVHRHVGGLPDFAPCQKAGRGDAHGPDGRALAPYLVRVGGVSAPMEDGVRRVAAAAAAVRPDLFRPGPDVAVGPPRVMAPAPGMAALPLIALSLAGVEALAVARVIVAATGR